MLCSLRPYVVLTFFLCSLIGVFLSTSLSHLTISSSYFHGSIDRDEAVSRLQSVNQDGAFLLRTSKNQAGAYTISVQCGSTINHVRVTNSSGGYALGQGKPFKTVWEMVEAHLGLSMSSTGKGGEVGVSLRIPVANDNDKLGSGAADVDGMSEQEIAIKIMNGELPPDFEMGKPRASVANEEELMQKILNGEIDPNEAQHVQVSKSAWRKQKGAGTKADAQTAQDILDGKFDPDAVGEVDEDTDHDRMMASIMDGSDPDAC